MSLKYLAAYCLAQLGGKATPTKDDVKRILTEVGVNVNETDLEHTVKTLTGKQLHEVIAAGQKKLANVSFGGGSGGSAPAKAEEKKPEKEAAKAPAKKEEPKKEDVDDGLGGGLFGDDF